MDPAVLFLQFSGVYVKAQFNRRKQSKVRLRKGISYFFNIFQALSLIFHELSAKNLLKRVSEIKHTYIIKGLSELDKILPDKLVFYPVAQTLFSRKLRAH